MSTDSATLFQEISRLFSLKIEVPFTLQEKIEIFGLLTLDAQITAKTSILLSSVYSTDIEKCKYLKTLSMNISFALLYLLIISNT